MVLRTKRKRMNVNRVFIFLTLVLILVSITSITINYILKSKKEAFHDVSQQSSQISSSEDEKFEIATDNIVSKHVILKRLDNNKILYEKNSEERIFPASLTKIMTAIVAIENIPDLQQKITLSSEMFSALNKANAAVAGFGPNETVSAEDLLYGALLPSGAECTVGLADFISGSEHNFAVLMNDKAAELKMVNTHFINTTGLHNPEHYSTVKDLSILLQYALKNENFRKIFTTVKHSTNPTNKHKTGITFYSSTLRYLTGNSLKNGEILGGKTGYTDEAKLCLASLAEIKGHEYILITAEASGIKKTIKYNFQDAVNVYNSIGSSKINS